MQRSLKHKTTNTFMHLGWGPTKSVSGHKAGSHRTPSVQSVFIHHEIKNITDRGLRRQKLKITTHKQKDQGKMISSICHCATGFQSQWITGHRLQQTPISSIGCRNQYSVMRGRKLSEQFDQNSAYNNIKTSIVSLCDTERSNSKETDLPFNKRNKDRLRRPGKIKPN